MNIFTEKNNSIDKNKSGNRDKGKNRILLPDDFTLIDIETTGLMPLYDEIIELSALKIRNNEIVDTFTELVKPDDLNINSFITELTGITKKMLEGADKIKKVLPKFIDFVGNDLVLGYNVNFDINFIYDNLKGCFNKDFKNDFVDVMRIVRKLCLNLQDYKLKTVAQYYKVNSDNAHRGLEDCKITFEVYKLIKNEILSKYGDSQTFYQSEWYNNYTFYAKNLKPTNENFDVSHPLYNMNCVFTGTLSKMDRKKAFQIVLDLGGHISENLNLKTNFLIVGEQDYTKLNGKEKSNKMIRAENYILKGADLKIIPEQVFYDLIQDCVNE